MKMTALLACVLASTLTGCVVGGDDADGENPDAYEDTDETDSAAFAADDAIPLDLSTCNGRQIAPTASANANLTTKVELSGHPAWATFTEPLSGQTGDIITGVTRLIDAVPWGGSINGTVHSLGLHSVAVALACAHARGVHVNIVADGGKFDGKPITTFLQGNVDNLILCHNHGGDGCGTVDSSAIMHSKVFTFSTTLAPDGAAYNHVSWFGSANLTEATGMVSANNTLTVFDHPALEQKLNEYILRLALKQTDPGTKVAFSDSDEIDGVASPSVSADNDIIKNKLDQIEAGECSIDIEEGLLSHRPKLFAKIANLAGRCAVRIIGSNGYREKEDGTRVYNSRREDLATMAAGGAKIKLAKVHDKLLIIDAHYAGGERRRYVYTGSHNMTASANAINDELLVQVRGADVYNAYEAHFQRIWDATTERP